MRIDRISRPPVLTSETAMAGAIPTWRLPSMSEAPT
jgi:hypothetical protein